MITMTISSDVQKYQEAKPTSGHLNLIRSKRNQEDDERQNQKNEERPQEKSVQKLLVFIGCYEHCKF